MTDSDTSAENVEQPSRLLDYLRLFRLPNVFTAVADILMGFVFTGGFREVSGMEGRIGALAALVIASSLMYTAGMVLNDVYDFEKDSQERPERPLPSGRISLPWARFLGYWMLLTGVAVAACAGLLFPGPDSVSWRSGCVALLLAVSVIGYDAILKHTMMAPLAMGACRFFNVLLGMSAGMAWVEPPLRILYFQVAEIAVAAGIGVYIAGVTWFARTEARVSNRAHLTGALFVMLAGLALLICYPQFSGGKKLPDDSDMGWMWPILVMLLGLTLFRRAATAIANPQPAKVQATIKQCIFSLILLDAAVCLSTGNVVWSLIIVALLAPMFLLGRWVYST